MKRVVSRGAAIVGLAILAACAKSPTPVQSPQRGVVHTGQRPVIQQVAFDVPAVRFAVKEEPPVSLTATDGTGLKLAALNAQAVVDGSIAFTELRLAFDNPESRTIEGTFRITLPQGATLQRFAMKIGNEYQESEVVELEQARVAYEDFLHRRQDPALLENAAGNEFSARVFPIPANAKKEIIVSYVQDLKGQPYVLPLKGMPELGKLDAKVTIVGAKGDPAKLSAQNERPAQDFVVDPKVFGQDANNGVRAGDLVVARVKPQAESKPDPITNVVIMVDTSASRALGFEEQLRVLAQLVSKVAEAKGEITVATFDQVVKPIFEGAAASFGDAQMKAIRAHGALGASDVEKALAWAGKSAKQNNRRRVILLSDGVPTAGATEAARLSTIASGLRQGGVERLDAIAIGGIRDDAGLLRLARNVLPRDGVVVAANERPETIAKKLGEETRSGIPVVVEGATWAWPQKLDGVQAGDEITIYAEVPANKPVRIAVGGKPAQNMELRQTARPLVQRVIAQAQVASLLERELQTKQDLKKEITALAVRHRVLCPYTAMLVLETEHDYARFNIDRRTPPEILAIADGKIFVAPRAIRGMAVATRTVEADDPMSRPIARKPPSAKPKPTRNIAKRADDSDVSAVMRDSGGAPGGGGGSGPTLATKDKASGAASGPARPSATMAPPAEAPARKTAEKKEDAKPAKRASAAPAPAAQDDGARGMDGDEEFAPPPPPSNTPRRASESASRGAGVEPLRDGMQKPEALPYTGKFKEVMERLEARDVKGAIAIARGWRSEEPGDVMALIALGEVAEAAGALEIAARAYGSIIDLFPNRADLRRFAGERLERIGDKHALELAIDAFEKAQKDRPDHPASHRLLAFALLRANQPQRAFEVLTQGATRSYPPNRFRGVERIFREDLGLAAAAWIRQDPKNQADIERRLLSAGGVLENEPSLRFVLNWETDANDVDFHIYDGTNDHAFYSHPMLASGGELYADVTTGYGPECFTVRGSKETRTGPYTLQAHYYSRGPMGYGMGKLEVIEHDGNGNLVFDERPFVVMNDRAFVDLGTVK